MGGDMALGGDVVVDSDMALGGEVVVAVGLMVVD